MIFTNNLKFFLTALLVISGSALGVNFLGNVLEDFFFWRELSSNPQILTAQANQMALAQMMRTAKPFLNNDAENLELQAKAALTVLLNERGAEKILFEKNADDSLPIASLSKLMTVKVILDNYDFQKEITITKEAVAQEENLGKLRVGAVLTVEQLLYPLLMESSNDAAYALANDYDGLDEQAFVGLMNALAQKLGLDATRFVNSTGLDPEENEPRNQINLSSARDLATLTEELLKTPLVWEILATPKINLYGETLANTNKLLGVLPGIIGGKTGYTDTALGCFVLVVEAPKGKGTLINVVLGSPDRFLEMEKLINWARKAYDW